LKDRSIAKAQLIAGQSAKETLGLSDEARRASVTALNQILADSICLRDMYKKYHWQAAGAAFYRLHSLFDEHADEQSEIIDSLAERVYTLGGASIPIPGDGTQLSHVAMLPRDREEVSVQVSRTLEAHEQLLVAARALARAFAELGDERTNDLLVNEVVRKNELQAWFLSELVVDVRLMRARWFARHLAWPLAIHPSGTGFELQS
jgi:starvation-inducible DNA-binding protein